MRKILGILFAFCVYSTATADIYQWYDGDGDGSLWLSSSNPEPLSDLSRELLWWADLHNTNLFSAYLSTSNLSFADIRNANLEDGDLSFTIFFGADLSGSNITNANLFYADVSNANLSNIENWESAFWLAARYSENTLFPVGMDPDDFGMIEIEVPAPGMIPLLCIPLLIQRRRR